MISAFGRSVIKDGGFDEATGRLLRSLFERRTQADYGTVDVPREEAERAIADAERFVATVRAWIARRAGG